MTDKELRSLKRADLIEILYYLRRENDELREENEALKAQQNRMLEEIVNRLENAPPAAESVPANPSRPPKTNAYGKKKRKR